MGLWTMNSLSPKYNTVLCHVFGNNIARDLIRANNPNSNVVICIPMCTDQYVFGIANVPGSYICRSNRHQNRLICAFNIRIAQAAIAYGVVDYVLTFVNVSDSELQNFVIRRIDMK